MPATNACSRFKANVNTRCRSVTGVAGSHKGRGRYAGRVDLSSTFPVGRRQRGGYRISSLTFCMIK